MPSSSPALFSILLVSILALHYSTVLGCAPNAPKAPKDHYADLLTPGTECKEPALEKATCLPTCKMAIFNSDKTRIMCTGADKLYFTWGPNNVESSPAEYFYCTAKGDWASSVKSSTPEIAMPSDIKDVFCKPQS